ncbi:MAG: flagellar biosynthetic protein FliO [Vicinamibacterales bacterium]
MIPFLIAQAGMVGSGTPDLVPSLWRVVGGLAVVLALLAGLAWVLRRSSLLKRGAGGFSVESALQLGERRSLVVVTIEGRRLLLGLAPNCVALVTELGARPAFEAAVTQALSKELPS